MFTNAGWVENLPVWAIGALKVKMTAVKLNWGGVLTSGQAEVCSLLKNS